MAPLFIFINLLLILIATTTSSATNSPKPRIPVLKDTKSGLYYTVVTVGQPPLAVNLVVDVSGTPLWFSCEELGYNSTTFTPILCGSPECRSNDLCSECSSPPSLTCSNTTCQSFVKSDLDSGVTYGHLYKDNVILSYMSPPASPKLVVRTRLACVPYFETDREAPAGSKGFLGLRDFLVKGLVSSYKIPFKVALCLPSNGSGNVYIGGGPYGKDVAGSLVSTPLILDHIGLFGYYIDVKSIQVNGKSLSLKSKNGPLGPTKISNVIPYTRLESSIYKALVKAFTRKADKRKAVAPFADCFSYKSFGGKNKTPVISLVLEGGGKWDIYRPNSLVKVRKDVLCLAFENAGSDRIIPIEIGGYQLEDHLVEFDLHAWKFSVSSSLLRHNTSCSPH